MERTVLAMIHSKNKLDEVIIMEEAGPNHVVAEYHGKRYRAIHNVFNGLYYVDDVYGQIGDADE